MRWDFAIGLERVRTDAATRLQAALRRLLAIIRLHRVTYGYNTAIIRRITRYEDAMGTWMER